MEEVLDRIYSEIEAVKREVQGLRVEVSRSFSVIETVLGIHNGGYRLDRRVGEIEVALEDFRRSQVEKRLLKCEEEVARLKGEVGGFWRLIPLFLSILSILLSVWRLFR